ncbi:MAG TPA: hypothetical protein VIF13_06335 [Hyphomicrobium sp.]
MARMRLIATIAGVLAAALSLASNASLAGPSASANDTARFLAGLPTSAQSPLTPSTNDAFWKEHARIFDTAWAGLDKRQLSKIRTMVSKNFNDPQPVLFYFFSGPDFLYANSFFPSADTYVMAGLEPPGPVPDLSKLSRGEMAGALRELRSSLNSVLSYSFFQTKSMRLDFGKGHLTGTLPVLMTFLARSGKTIYDVSLFDLQSDGTIHPVEDKIPNAKARGAKIIFSDNIGKKRTLYYFSTDLSDGGIKDSGFMLFCDKLGHGDAFVKSASYLMHSDKFSTVRDYLLTHTASILQDDSGIPIRFFAQGWRLHPFGRYVGPIALFGNQYQSQLTQVFAKGHATPIDFGVGYRWRPNESNLLLAVKDGTATAMEIPPASSTAQATEPARKVRAEAREAQADRPRRSRRTYHRHRERTVSNPNSKMFGYLPN